MQGFCYHRPSCCQCVNRIVVKWVPKSPPRGRELKYSLRFNLLSGLPSREAALALIFQSPLDGSTSDLQRLRNGRRRDGPEHRQKPERARREILAMYQRPFERRSLPLLPYSRHFRRQSACLKGANNGSRRPIRCESDARKRLSLMIPPWRSRHVVTGGVEPAAFVHVVKVVPNDVRHAIGSPGIACEDFT
jgi:hypothetical protein